MKGFSEELIGADPPLVIENWRVDNQFLDAMRFRQLLESLMNLVGCPRNHSQEVFLSTGHFLGSPDVVTRRLVGRQGRIMPQIFLGAPEKQTLQTVLNRRFRLTDDHTNRQRSLRVDQG